MLHRVQAHLSKPLTLALVPLLFLVYRLSRRLRRSRKVAKVGERVLVLGASSGVGRTIARQYAERGADVCIVGRREVLIKEVEQECRDARSLLTIKIEKNSVLSIPADFTNVEDMVRLRDILDESM